MKKKAQKERIEPVMARCGDIVVSLLLRRSEFESDYLLILFIGVWIEAKNTEQ